MNDPPAEPYGAEPGGRWKYSLLKGETMTQTIETLKAVGDCQNEALHVCLERVMCGFRHGRIITIGRKYVRVMLGDGRILSMEPDQITEVWK